MSVLGSAASLHQLSLCGKVLITNVNILSYHISFTRDSLSTAPSCVCSLICIKGLSLVLDLHSRVWMMANGTIGHRSLDLRDGCLVNASRLPSSCCKLIGRSRTINIRESLLVGANTADYVRGGARENVTAYDGEVGEDFTDFTVGRNEVCKRANVARGCGC